MSFDLDSSIDVLRRTPPTLRAFLGGMAEPLVRGNEGPETFSPFDVVGHPIDGKETNWMTLPRIMRPTPPTRASPHTIDSATFTATPVAVLIRCSTNLRG